MLLGEVSSLAAVPLMLVVMVLATSRLPVMVPPVQAKLPVPVKLPGPKNVELGLPASISVVPVWICMLLPSVTVAASSLLPYWAYRQAPDSALPADEPGPVPVAIDIFGGEIVPFPKPPRELAERYFHVTHWAQHGRGGHFPAVAEPRLLADRLREVFRPCRGS